MADRGRVAQASGRAPPHCGNFATHRKNGGEFKHWQLRQIRFIP
jgi:hypothetical protein